MHETGKKLLSLMFRPGETVCVSHNKYGYHSIPLSEVLTKEKVILVPTPDSCDKRGIEWGPEVFEHTLSDDLQLVALNPINGFREDANAYKYRNFLIEMDYGPLAKQLEYAKQLKLPYSAVVFSGGKSLHFLVSLDQDLPSEKIWRHMSEWSLNIVTLADQNTKNPSRSIRIPGAKRDDKYQQLVEYVGPTKVADWASWLSEHMEAKPKEAERRKVSDHYDFSKLKDWVPKRLISGNIGAKLGRNKEWYAIAFEFALAGYPEDVAIDILSKYYSEERDFREKEWLVTIKSAFKNAYSRKE